MASRQSVFGAEACQHYLSDSVVSCYDRPQPNNHRFDFDLPPNSLVLWAVVDPLSHLLRWSFLLVTRGAGPCQPATEYNYDTVIRDTTRHD